MEQIACWVKRITRNLLNSLLEWIDKRKDLAVLKEADISLRAISLQLYHFMCQHIVGTEETVRTKRLISMIDDNLKSDDKAAYITSGSVGEGLELKGSDLDIMVVWKNYIVHKDTDIVIKDPRKKHFVMEINETKPGFTLLRSLYISDEFHTIVQKDNSWYLSSELFKLNYLKTTCETVNAHIHGPCLTDENEVVDFAACLHCPHWIPPAENWIQRGHTLWPSSDVKSDIIDHGVLFVPIGSKGSVDEAMEWRISFSVAEKLLIYSFSHPQLLCYALMKILLKDLINSNINCKNLLCSYFIKTTIFWLSEETSVTEWKPENLIQCFMRCFKRLLYCVEYSMCPHYFIPINNMFENKIEEQPRQVLLEHLNTLLSFGWRCVLFSEHFQNFIIHSNALPSTFEIKRTQLERFLTSFASYSPIIYPNESSLKYRKCIRILRINNCSVIKSTCLRFMSVICSSIQQNIVTSFEINKKIYSLRRIQLAYLLQNLHHDAVSGWLMLSVFFYKINRYRDVLYILSYAMSKCTPEKVYYQNRLSQLQLNTTKSTTLQRLGLVRVLKLLQVRKIAFIKRSTLLPEELAFDCLQKFGFPPVAFAHFLCFMCYYHLNDTQQCDNSIRNIQLTIDENYFIGESNEKAKCYFLLGIALYLMRQTYLAICALTNAFHLKTDVETAATKLLSMMYTSFERDG